MSTDPELCSFITNVCKPLKNLDFPGIAQPFRLVWFEEFPWVCHSSGEDRTYYLSGVLFSYKNVGKSLQKTISNMENSSKNIEKHQNVPAETSKKRQILFHSFLGKYALFLRNDHGN